LHSLLARRNSKRGKMQGTALRTPQQTASTQNSFCSRHTPANQI
jgi:hypothetical protein